LHLLANSDVEDGLERGERERERERERELFQEAIR
jgi:hypothetical protein